MAPLYSPPRFGSFGILGIRDFDFVVHFGFCLSGLDCLATVILYFQSSIGGYLMAFQIYGFCFRSVFGVNMMDMPQFFYALV